MVGDVCEPPRVSWLDGLRGIAAMQVVLLHYASAFLPAIGLWMPELAHYRWEKAFIGTPLFLPFDGYSAIYIFFVLSGIVLTYAFSARPFEIVTNLMRRIVRLGLPMAAAILFGALLFDILPDAHFAAATLTGSKIWLGALVQPPLSVSAVTHQILLEGMLTGYLDATLFGPHFGNLLGSVTLDHSYDDPLSTLHIEFYGSLLILALVGLRAAAGRAAHLLACVLLAACFVGSPIILFIIGHSAAPWVRMRRRRNWHPRVGVGALLLGFSLCTTGELVPLKMLHDLLPTPLFGPLLSPANLQSMIGALLVFFGLSLLPHVHRHLDRPAMRWLGKISFSLYLTHFPLVFTVTSAWFLIAIASLPYGASVAVVCVLGIGTSIVIAMAFERYIDRPAIILSRMISFRSSDNKDLRRDIA